MPVNERPTFVSLFVYGCKYTHLDVYLTNKST